MIGSTMLAAPSTMSSGGLNPYSAVIASARCTESSSMTQPVSTLFHVDGGRDVVGCDARVIILSARVAMGRMRMTRRLEASVELPLDLLQDHVDAPSGRLVIEPARRQFGRPMPFRGFRICCEAKTETVDS
jgi:hypothetical protein